MSESASNEVKTICWVDDHPHALRGIITKFSQACKQRNLKAVFLVFGVEDKDNFDDIRWNKYEYKLKEVLNDENEKITGKKDSHQDYFHCLREHYSKWYGDAADLKEVSISGNTVNIMNRIKEFVNTDNVTFMIDLELIKALDHPRLNKEKAILSMALYENLNLPCILYTSFDNGESLRIKWENIYEKETGKKTPIIVKKSEMDPEGFIPSTVEGILGRIFSEK